jgi:L-alanine-DL-glutamate epimerase-like enolase superfamily enzyme
MFEIFEADVSFRSQRLATPLKLSSGPIRELTQATVSVVGAVDGRHATGCGTIYLSDLWAWPDDSLSHENRDAALRQLCERLAQDIPQRFRNVRLHPIELGLQLHHLACFDIVSDINPPVLARAMCASPFDAAIHDAAGYALGRSAFALYEDTVELRSADTYFPEGGACSAIHSVIQRPRFELAAWYVVGVDEALETTLVPAIRRHGYRCFKLKLTGRNNELDVARTSEVYRVANASGASHVRLTVDTNEANLSVESVVDYLERLKEVDSDAIAALAYLEQPTSRDIRNQAFDWRPVTKYVPVMIDEGLTDLDVLAEARRQGYSGLALKTCKGHSMLLVCAAWAHRHGMTISLQDLTNPGIALIHAALVGAHLPTINGAELNSPQFTPAANDAYVTRLPELFIARNGIHRVPRAIPAGLGSHL